MTEAGYSIVLRDASLIDVAELKAEIPPGDIRIVEPGSGDNHDELATIVVVSLTVLALKALTMWAMKDRESEVVEQDVTVRRPDGTEVTIRTKIDRKSSKAPETQVIEQVANGLKLPEDAILSASAG